MNPGETTPQPERKKSLAERSETEIANAAQRIALDEERSMDERSRIIESLHMELLRRSVGISELRNEATHIRNLIEKKKVTFSDMARLSEIVTTIDEFDAQYGRLASARTLVSQEIQSTR